MFNYESKLNNKILILTFISINIHFHDSPSYNGFFFYIHCQCKRFHNVNQSEIIEYNRYEFQVVIVKVNKLIIHHNCD